jgi:hypothetical protein
METLASQHVDSVELGLRPDLRRKRAIRQALLRLLSDRPYLFCDVYICGVYICGVYLCGVYMCVVHIHVFKDKFRKAVFTIERLCSL